MRTCSYIIILYVSVNSQNWQLVRQVTSCGLNTSESGQGGPVTVHYLYNPFRTKTPKYFPQEIMNQGRIQGGAESATAPPFFGRFLLFSGAASRNLEARSPLFTDPGSTSVNLYCIIKLATEISLFSLQISKNLMFWVDKIRYEYLAILSNLKICQFAPRIAIFNLCICCQFEDLQIILPKIIPMSHRNI